MLNHPHQHAHSARNSSSGTRTRSGGAIEARARRSQHVSRHEFMSFNPASTTGRASDRLRCRIVRCDVRVADRRPCVVVPLGIQMRKRGARGHGLPRRAAHGNGSAAGEQGRAAGPARAGAGAARARAHLAGQRVGMPARVSAAAGGACAQALVLREQPVPPVRRRVRPCLRQRPGVRRVARAVRAPWALHALASPPTCSTPTTPS